MSDRSQNRFLYAKWIQKDGEIIEGLVSVDEIQMIFPGDQKNTCLVILKDKQSMRIKVSFDDLSKLLLGALD
jgi:hypothetical protein